MTESTPILRDKDLPCKDVVERLIAKWGPAEVIACFGTWCDMHRDIPGLEMVGWDILFGYELPQRIRQEPTMRRIECDSRMSKKENRQLSKIIDRRGTASVFNLLREHFEYYEGPLVGVRHEIAKAGHLAAMMSRLAYEARYFDVLYRNLQSKASA